MLVGAYRSLIKSPAVVAAPSAFAFSDLFSGHKGDWWDFTTAAQNFTDAGSTPVASLDDLVYRTNGRVNGNYLEQATSGNRGLWKQTNGLALDNSNDYMSTAALPSTITDTTATFIAVLRLDGNSNYQRIAGLLATFLGSDTGSAAAAAGILRSGTSGNLTAFRNGAEKGAQALSDSVFALVESEFDGTNHTMTVNGSSGTPVASTGSFGGNYIHLGINGGSPGFATLKHLVVINKVLSAGEKTAMRAAYP